MQRIGASLARAASQTRVTARCQSSAAPERIEVFVDDKKVLVDPGMTILQVSVSNSFPTLITLGLRSCWRRHPPILLP